MSLSIFLICGLLFAVVVISIWLRESINQKVELSREGRKRNLREVMDEEELWNFIHTTKLDSQKNLESVSDALYGLSQRGTISTVKFLLDHFSNNTADSRLYTSAALTILSVSQRLGLTMPPVDLFLSKQLRPADRLEIHAKIFEFNGSVPRLKELVAAVKEMQPTDNDKLRCWIFLARIYYFGPLGPDEKMLISDMKYEVAGILTDKSWREEYSYMERDDAITRKKVYETKGTHVTGRDVLFYTFENKPSFERSEPVSYDLQEIINFVSKHKKASRQFQPE